MKRRDKDTWELLAPSYGLLRLFKKNYDFKITLTDVLLYTNPSTS